MQTTVRVTALVSQRHTVAPVKSWRYQYQRPALWMRLAPILTVEVYLTLTVCAFAFGPWPWPINNPFELYLYVFAAQLALFIGYYSHGTRTGRGYSGRWNAARLFSVSLIFNVIFILPKLYVALGMDGFTLSAILSSIYEGLSDPGTAYVAKMNRLMAGTTYSTYMKVYVVVEPILWVGIPIGFARWRLLSSSQQLVLGIVVLGDIASWLAIGTTKGIADMAIILAVTLVTSNNLRRLFSRKTFKHLVFASCCVFLALAYFGYAQYSRMVSKTHIPYDRDARIALDTDSIFVEALPQTFTGLTAHGFSYFCQGYYGLSLAMQEPFEWTYGIGHSLYLTGIAKQFGFDVTEKTYPAQAERHGWGRLNRWHTAYTWFASDVTFPGTLILLACLGRLFAATWADVRLGQNPFALPLFVLIVMMMLYLNANNQVLSMFTTVSAFYTLLVCWASTRAAVRPGSRSRIR